MSLTLTWRGATRLPTDGMPIRPDQLASLSLDEVASLPIRVGNRPSKLGELFAIRGDPSDASLTLLGDLSPIRHLARGMAAGRLVVEGDVGPYFAAELAGGEVDLIGDAAGWAAAGMTGGFLRIRGAAADYLGAALPHAVRGLRGGAILVDGRVGAYAGLAQRRSLIAIRGPVGPALGHGLIAGSIFAFGPVSRPIAAGMKRGTLVLHDPAGSVPELLPTFLSAGHDHAPWLKLYFDQLTAWGFAVPPDLTGRAWHRTNGDTLVGGRGEVLF